MQNYRQFKITTEPFNVEILSSILWELEILGINEYDNYLEVFIDEGSEINSKTIHNILTKSVKEKLLNSFSIEEELLPVINWNEEWEKQINVIEVSDRIVIKPSFRDYEAKENQIIITIDPKMSFGTGEHETTRIVLLLLEKYLEQGVNVLDVGSGTAILSIAAALLGAKKVLAIDNDEWCFTNGIENIERNNINNVIVQHNTINKIEADDFDLVLANINKNILLDIKTELANKCKKDGLVILSGILLSDEDEIKRQFTQIGLTALDQKQINEWIGIVFQRTLN
jgi:ribosomal protein L11 methyltransferase